GSGTSDRSRSWGRGVAAASFVSLFFISDEKHGTAYRRDPYISGIRNDYFVAYFGDILRIGAAAQIDSRCAKNIGCTTSLPAQVYPDEIVFYPSFMTKVCYPEEAILGNRDVEGRRRNDFRLESAGKSEARGQKKDAKGQSSDLDFGRHTRCVAWAN